MKKLVSLLLALVCLCSFTVAMAESVPSKSTADMVTVTIKADGVPANAGFVIAPANDPVADAAKIEACQEEIAKLSAATNVETYFGEVKTPAGEAVSLTEILGTDTLNVFEFMPIKVLNYDTTYGKVVATFQFATVYAVNEEVIVLIGVPAPFTGEIAWTALNGIGVAGGVEIEFDEATLDAIQGSYGMMAIVSK